MLLIKIGGGASIDLDAIIKDLTTIEENIIIVHGANALRDDLSARLGIEKEIITSVSGHTSVKSTDELIDVMLMSYAGLRNKRIVEKLQQQGINAVGLSGIDGGIIRGRRNKGIRARKDGKRVIIRDNSGKPQEINTELLQLLLDNSYTPVLTVPIVDENNNLINSENDDIVGTICEQVEITRVIMFIEEVGLLRDKDDPKSLLHTLDKKQLEVWENEVSGRMKRKLYAIRQMLNEHGPVVHISDGRIENPVRSALNGEGTVISWQ